VDPERVLGRIWRWQATVTPTEKITVTSPERYTLFLTADGTARIRFDCNRGGGSFEISPGKVSFGPLISTRMTCPPDSRDAAFRRDLQQVRSFFVERGTLFLALPDNRGTMRFRPGK
jgi:heat shock protein HslJ